MEQVKDNSEFQWSCKECKQTTGTHRLSLWPGGRNRKFRALPSDTTSTCKMQGWFLFLHVMSPCWCFCKRKGKLTETGVTLGCCGSAATLPGWLQSSFLPIFPMAATHSTASAESREGNSILMSHHVTRDDSLTVGVHKAITQHKWQLFPWGATLGGLC